MSVETAPLLLLAGLTGLWALLQLALLGMYNYQLSRLVNQPPDVQHRRLGGLLQIDSLSISPSVLIDWLKMGETVPVLPYALLRNVAVALIFMTISGVATLEPSYTLVELLETLVGLPILIIGGSFAMVGIHVFFVELRLWWSDEEECRQLYEILSESDEDAFPWEF